MTCHRPTHTLTIITIIVIIMHAYAYAYAHAHAHASRIVHHTRPIQFSILCSHSPGLEVMPNGDVLAVWFSSAAGHGEPGKESSLNSRMVQVDCMVHDM